jgi:ABC-type branched-subunit amino acid transport system substrate-binding protein
MSNRDPSRVGRGLSRRDALVRLGLYGAGALAAPGLLAACGDDDDSSGGGATTARGGPGTTAGGSASTAAGTATTTGGSAAPAGDVGVELAELLQIDPNADNAKGVDWTMGAVLALTGNGSYYGTTMTNGIDLAVRHVEAAGGPKIKVIYKDHKSGDAQAGTQAMTELGTAKVPAKLASYADDLGAMLAGTKQYKCFTLDGGGGTSIFAQGQDYFWGTRAITPNDALPGLFEYVKQTSPDARTVGLTGWDIGEPSNSIVKKDILQKISDAGYEYNDLYELFPPNSTDFAATLTKIQANEPDVLLCGCYGQDPGFLLDQTQTAGLSALMYGFEFTPDGVNASNGAYDSVGWTFAYDYFDAPNPISPLAKLFVREFKAANGGTDPDFYAANFYENVLVMWEVIRRVLAKGGDINDGAQLDAALQENLTVVSVYGGDESTVGTYTLDPTTHSVIKRPMGVFQYKDGSVTPLAYYGIGGAEFTMA